MSVFSLYTLVLAVGNNLAIHNVSVNLFWLEAAVERTKLHETKNKVAMFGHCSGTDNEHIRRL